jgi:membrane protein involved in D-alanine export
MLPFSSIDFFLLFAILVGLLFFIKAWLPKIFSYSTILLGISVFYLVFFYPKPYHLVILVGYSYLIYYLFTYKLRLKNKLAGVLLLVLPMILVKTNTITSNIQWNEFISFAGLSYITFRIVSVYMDATPQSTPANFFKYISFLIFTPSLLIGPIDRFNRFSGDLDGGFSRLNPIRFLEGWQFLLYGVLHKFIIAEAINRYWLGPIDVESREFWVMMNSMYAYYAYLYFDFAGYSAMAIGLGKIMGIDVPINFDKPFLAVNPQDYWRRWHKSLGDWLKDYFFMPFYKAFTKWKPMKPYPLFRQNISLFMTFLLMGCWNGFKFNYILSGCIFGLYSVVHNSYVYQCRKKGKDIVFRNLSAQTVKVISIVVMINVTAIAIYVFSGRIPF